MNGIALTLARATAFGVAVILVTSCGAGSNEKRNYRIPSKICSTNVKTSHSQALLPAGDSLEVKKTSLSAGNTACEANVDNKRAFLVTLRKSEEKNTTEALWELSLLDYIDNPEKDNLGPVTAIIGSNGSAVVYPCTNKKYRSVRMELKVSDPNVAKKEDIRNFTEDFTLQAIGSEQCAQ